MIVALITQHLHSMICIEKIVGLRDRPLWFAGGGSGWQRYPLLLAIGLSLMSDWFEEKQYGEICYLGFPPRMRKGSAGFASPEVLM